MELRNVAKNIRSERSEGIMVNPAIISKTMYFSSSWWIASLLNSVLSKNNEIKVADDEGRSYTFNLVKAASRKDVLLRDSVQN